MTTVEMSGSNRLLFKAKQIQVVLIFLKRLFGESQKQKIFSSILTLKKLDYL